MSWLEPINQTKPYPDRSRLRSRRTPNSWRSTAPSRACGRSPSAIHRLTSLSGRRSSSCRRWLSEFETDQSLKVVVFEAADPDFFIAHFDTSKAAETPTIPARHRFCSLDRHRAAYEQRSGRQHRQDTRADARRRATSSFSARDMRFASRQKAIFGNPEVGVGVPPGGGALKRLPRVVGRSRALEIALERRRLRCRRRRTLWLGQPHPRRRRTRRLCRQPHEPTGPRSTGMRSAR